MMYCERCNAEFAETMTYCKWCGQTLVERHASTTEVRKCNSCSTPLPEGFTFCNACGAKVTPAAQESASPLCLRCGAVIAPGASACLRCGQRFTSERSALQKASGNVQYCFTCGDAMEAGKLYCKTCGAPVYNPSAPLDLPLAPPVEQNFAPPITPPSPPPDRWVGTQEPPQALPAEPFKETLMIESPVAPSTPSSPRTEVYQSLKPQTALPESGSTIDLTQQQTTSPTEAQTRNEDALPSPGKTIAYGGFNLLTDEAKSPSAAEEEDNRATMQILFASDLQAEPDTLDSFITDQETAPPISPDASAEPLSVGGDLVFSLEITPLEAPAEPFDQAPINQPTNQVFADPNESAAPLTQSGTMRLDLDALPFESTVKEDTGPLTANRPTTKLTGLEALNPLAVEGKAWQPPTENADAREANPAPQEPVEQLPQEPIEQLPQEPIEPLPQEPITILSQPIYTQPPAKHSVNTWQEHQPAAPPWPSNQPSVAQPAAKKSGAVPLALIAATVIVLGLAVAAVWWFVLRTPSGGVISNTNTVSNANTNLATTNTSTANTNTTTSLAVPEGMLAIAAGEYTLGRDDGDDIEKPRHTIVLKAFFIDKTEVTNAEYKKFVEATNQSAPPHWQNKTFPEGQANFPVVRVTWQDANDYAKWAGKRLPTEAEWEAAARGATARKYPWGNDWNQAFANIGVGESGSLKEVGKYPEGQSPFGAMDMIGNAWEWTADRIALYPGNIGKAPEEANSNYRVIRGGAFNGDKSHDASYRGYIDANTNRKDLDKTGFRCVKDAP